MVTSSLGFLALLEGLRCCARVSACRRRPISAAAPGVVFEADSGAVSLRPLNKERITSLMGKG